MKDERQMRLQIMCGGYYFLLDVAYDQGVEIRQWLIDTMQQAGKCREHAKSVVSAPHVSLVCIAGQISGFICCDVTKSPAEQLLEIAKKQQGEGNEWKTNGEDDE